MINPHMRILGSLVASGLAVCACGVSSPPASSNSTELAPHTSEVPPVRSSSGAHSSPSTLHSTTNTATSSAMFTGKDTTQGYSAKLSITLGPIGHATPTRSNGTMVLGAQCVGGNTAPANIDPQTDAAIPFTLTMTNTTNGFSLNGEDFSATSAGPVSNGGSPLLAEEETGSGPECNAEADLYVSSLAPGATASVAGFFLLFDYYSPAHPNGDLSALSNDVLVLQSLFLPWDRATGSSGLLPYHVSDYLQPGHPSLPVVSLIVGTHPSCTASSVCSNTGTGNTGTGNTGTGNTGTGNTGTGNTGTGNTGTGNTGTGNTATGNTGG
jgi:PPE-repeat protein